MRRRGRLGRASIVGAVVTALLLAGWLAAGNSRASGLARDYFLAHHGSSTIQNITIDAESPWMPPLWSVRISGDVLEQGGSTTAYRS